MVEIELFEFKVTLSFSVFSPLPFLVVIKITPFAPLEPYIAVAEASLRTTKEAISLGLINDSGLAAPAIPPLSKGTPSTTIKGSLLALMDVPPLNLMVLPDPGAPSLVFTFSPETLPIINCSGVAIEPLTKFFSPTTTAEPVRSLLRMVPYPMTTTSSMTWSFFITKSRMTGS